MNAEPRICPVASSDPGLGTNPPRLLDQVRQVAVARGHAYAAGEALAAWTCRFVLFQNKRHPRELGLAEVTRFLEHVVRKSANPLRELDAARTALDFLYREVLVVSLGELPWPRPPRLLDQVCQAMRVRHYSPRTEECYVQWIRRFILFQS